jgi:hypothetical protein
MCATVFDAETQATFVCDLASVLETGKQGRAGQGSTACRR